MAPYSTKHRDFTVPQYVERISIQKIKDDEKKLNPILRFFKKIFLKSNFTAPYKNLKILDVGAWAGKRAQLLKPFYSEIHAVEIFKPYISRFNLNSLYKKIYNRNIMDMLSITTNNNYDLIILGDVLEHLNKEDWQRLINHFTSSEYCPIIIVLVPYNYAQWPSQWNDAETHLQPDLDPIIMARRYPKLKLKERNNQFGFYVFNPKNEPRN